MFPINFNFPYRKKDGSLITMEKALDGAGADLDLIDLDDVAITTPAEGEVLVYDNTAKKWKNSDAVNDILDTIEDIEDTMAENGAHNIIVNNAVSHVDNEVTYTVHDDKSITVTVASTTAADRYVELYHSTSNDRYKAGDKFKLSGGANNTITVLCLLDDVVVAISRGNVAEFTMPTVNRDIQFLLYLDADTAAQTVTVYPMLTRASDPSNEYTAPAMTNRELTDECKNLSNMIPAISIQKYDNLTPSADYNFTLEDDSIYLLITGKALNTDIGSSLFIVVASSYGSTLTQINKGSNIAVAVNNLTLTVNTDTQFVAARLIKIG